LSSSRAAKLFPALSLEDNWSTVRTIKLVPPGMVTARAARRKGVSKTQIRLKEKNSGISYHFLMGVGTVILKVWLFKGL